MYKKIGGGREVMKVGAKYFVYWSQNFGAALGFITTGREKKLLKISTYYNGAKKKLS